MTSHKPYLIRAIYAWICDNESTPYLYINTQIPNLLLPAHLLLEHPLVLNTSPTACKDLLIANEAITFQARFSGKAFDIYLPIASVIAIIAKENGQGMTFTDDNITKFYEQGDEDNTTAPPAKKTKKTAKHQPTDNQHVASKAASPGKFQGLKIIK